MLAAKMDQLLKKLEDNPETAPVQALDTRMTCEVCGNTGHSGSSYPKTRLEDANFIGNSSNFNNGKHPQPGWNSWPYIPFSGQSDSSGNSQQFNKPSSFDPKAVAMKNQLSFNKMLETQIAQLAASLPNANAGKLPGQPEPPPKEHINAVTPRGGKSTQDPPHPSGALCTNHTDKEKEKTTKTEEMDDQEVSTEATKEKAPSKTLPHEFYDTTVLPFPQRNKKAAADEQYSKFVEVIKKLYVNIPLLDAMQKSVAQLYSTSLHRRRTLAVIPFHAQLGTKSSIKPYVISEQAFNKLNHVALVPTSMCQQFADQSIRHPVGIAEDVPMKIQNFVIPVDSVVLDMEIDAKTPLILGWPFLSTAEARIDVGAGEVRANGPASLLS
ncbi:hypothetical protein U9M48_031091 [Paspalum notatum var. saurae]|uniref:Retrotransposon gag protein n=1 Tax=Paspalum notatum var. saurae TaxID=547442 RepID=A0AAQ3U528_PASNO